MTSFYTKISDNILNTKGYKKASSALFNSYIKKITGEEFKIEKDIVKKLTTAMQYFYQSDNNLIKNEGAEILSMLLYISGDEIPELIAIAEHIFNVVGDFPNIELLQKKFPNRFFKFSIFDEARKEFRRLLNTVEKINSPLTDYQRNLWEHLIAKEDIITSAPTSTGKTYIILKYLIEQIVNSSGAFIAVVVPTRALIFEVASNIYDIIKEKSYEDDIEICTFQNEVHFKDKTIFVMTQERLFEILQTNLLTFDYLFVDEAHNISDKSRGVLLHMTLQKLLEDSNPQIIISMPSWKYLNAFGSVFRDTNFTTRTTSYSPVAKIFIEVTLLHNNIILTKKNSEYNVTIKKNFTGEKFHNIIYRLGKGEKNIIYRNKTHLCENIADEIADLIPQESDNPRLIEASDYIEKFIHPRFSLAANLKKGVAFHYGPLPGVVRRMIESLARDNLIDFIACTSTLAEGVNLPAKNLFLQNPMHTPAYRPAEKLEDVVLNNIIGRAGRLLEHFAGNIFLIEPNKWKFKDYFEMAESKSDKIPTYYQLLNDNFALVIKVLQGNYDEEQDDIYTYYSIANKLLREFYSGTIDRTFSAKELNISQEYKNILLGAVQKAYEKLQVDQFTLEANPTVGYLQQNYLYNFLNNQYNLSDWALPYPMSPSLYIQLKKVCLELSKARIFLPHNNNVEAACAIAKKWIQGEPLRSIITHQMDRYRDNSCNKNERDIITIINTDIRFKMASSLRCYQLIFANVAQRRGITVNSVKLHGFIEVGGCDSRFVQLVNLGLSRETAIEVHGILRKEIEITSFGDLNSLYNTGALNTLHPITKKEIEKMLL
ncbi:MAG: DEAD/DEAH box helicase [Prevotellaceae bacterium]|jgi:hypothetical protein|nr:DEAD/DEAH box helicase [Prevotellaceae bacterium]